MATFNDDLTWISCKKWPKMFPSPIVGWVRSPTICLSIWDILLVNISQISRCSVDVNARQGVFLFPRFTQEPWLVFFCLRSKVSRLMSMEDIMSTSSKWDYLKRGVRRPCDMKGTSRLIIARIFQRFARSTNHNPRVFLFAHRSSY